MAPASCVFKPPAVNSVSITPNFDRLPRVGLFPAVKRAIQGTVIIVMSFVITTIIIFYGMGLLYNVFTFI